MELKYANGGHHGVGYMEFWDNAPGQTKTLTGASDMTRERFTVSGPDRSVRKVSIRLKRVSGSGALKVRLETGSGTLVEQGSIAASTVPVQDPTVANKEATWATYTFSSRQTLQSGKTYNLVFSTDSSTKYSMMAMREGASYGYHQSTYFADGTGQETSNGGQSWVAPYAWSNRNPEGDWQFYFE